MVSLKRSSIYFLFGTALILLGMFLADRGKK